MQTKRIAVIFGGPATLFIQWRLTECLSRELELRSTLTTQVVAEHVTENALARNLVKLQLCLHQLQRLDENIAYIIATDVKGAVIAHTFPGPHPVPLGQLPSPREDQAFLSTRFTLPDETPIMDVAVPILAGRAGYVHVGFDENALRESVAAVVHMVIYIIVLFLLIATIVSIVFSRIFMTRPLGAAHGHHAVRNLCRRSRCLPLPFPLRQRQHPSGHRL